MKTPIIISLTSTILKKEEIKSLQNDNFTDEQILEFYFPEQENLDRAFELLQQGYELQDIVNNL